MNHPVYPVDEVVIHQNSHLDEFGAAWVGGRLGKNRFPGLMEARFTFAGRGGTWYQGRPPEDWLKERTLCLGVGGKGRNDEPFLDEHEGPNSTGIPDKCVTDLMIEAAGLTDDRNLMEIVEFVRRTDMTAQSQPFDQSSLIKSLHGANPGKPLQVMKWAVFGLDSEYDRRQQGIDNLGHQNFDGLCALWLLGQFGKEQFPGVTEAALKFAEESREHGAGEIRRFLLNRFGVRVEQQTQGMCATDVAVDILGLKGNNNLKEILKFAGTASKKVQPFELAWLVNSAYATNPNKTRLIAKWTAFPLDAKYRQQEEFIEALRYVDESARTVRINGPQGKRLVILSGETDNAQFGKAARYRRKDAAVIVQRNGKGQIQIYSTAAHKVDLTEVFRVIIEEEESAGEADGMSRWHFQNGMVLNGSISCPDVTPTRLTLPQVINIVRQHIKYRA